MKKPPGPPVQYADPLVVSVELAGNHLHVRFRGVNNHALRDVLVGLWLGLPPDDRADHVRELQAYLDPDETPPQLSQMIGYNIQEHAPVEPPKEPT